MYLGTRGVDAEQVTGSTSSGSSQTSTNCSPMELLRRSSQVELLPVDLMFKTNQKKYEDMLQATGKLREGMGGIGRLRLGRNWRRQILWIQTMKNNRLDPRYLAF